jgi:integrase
MTRRRHFGSVRELPSNRFQARYPTPDGSQAKADRTFATKGDAQRFLTTVEADMLSGKWRDPTARTYTLATYADEWLEHRSQLAVRTRELYSDLLRLHIKPQLGSARLDGLTGLDIRRWHKGRSEATGPTRTRQAYSLLRTILNTAVRDGLITTNPCQITGAGSVRSPERPYMSREHASRLIDALPPHLRIPAEVTLLCHLRHGELLGLQRGDVDLRAGLLYIRRAVSRTKAGPVLKSPKNGDARAVSIPPEAMDALRQHLAQYPGTASSPLFVHPSGRPLARQHVTTGWAQARRLASLSEYRWHDLRHAGLTWFTQSGGTTRETMHRGGHRSASAALRYQHRSQERDTQLASRLRLRADPRGEEDAAS